MRKPMRRRQATERSNQPIAGHDPDAPLAAFHSQLGNRGVHFEELSPEDRVMNHDLFPFAQAWATLW